MKAAQTARRELQALAKSLDRRFRVVETTVQVGPRALNILHPASAEDLIDERDFERDERLPYWAELWPSSQVLGERLLDLTGAGRSLLELGCGAGLVTTCASLAGFEVVATDYYDDALRFTRVNAWRNGARSPVVMSLDWRSLPAHHDRFDVVIASDVLYERPYGDLVARTVDAFLSDDGTALVADPGRVAREDFITSAAGLGLRVCSHTDVPFTDGQVQQTIGVFELSRMG